MLYVVYTEYLKQNIQLTVVHNTKCPVCSCSKVLNCCRCEVKLPYIIVKSLMLSMNSALVKQATGKKNLSTFLLIDNIAHINDHSQLYLCLCSRHLAWPDMAGQLDGGHSGRQAVSPVWTHPVGDGNWMRRVDTQQEWTASFPWQDVTRHFYLVCTPCRNCKTLKYAKHISIPKRWSSTARLLQ